MGNINFAGNTYSGEVLEDLLVYTAHGNDTYEEGLIHIVPGIQKKKTLPHVSLGGIIQDNVPTPTSAQGGAGANGANQYTLAERYLEPKDFMVYLEFNPRDYEEFWRPFQPQGELVFRDLDPKVQATMLHLLIDKKDQYIGDSIWCSRKGGALNTLVSDSNDNTVLGSTTEAGPMKYFDGAIVRILNNLRDNAAVAANPNTATDEQKNEAASGKVVLAGNAAMTTGAAVETALYDIWRATPKRVRKNKKMKFVMGWDLWDLYDQYLSSKDVKYSENADVNKYKFKGHEIKVIDGIPEQTIVFGKFTKDTDSCLWMGVDYATDEESVKVEKLQANSELYFFQMRMKADVNIVLPSEIVVWTTYHYES